MKIGSNKMVSKAQETKVCFFFPADGKFPAKMIDADTIEEATEIIKQIRSN